MYATYIRGVVFTDYTSASLMVKMVDRYPTGINLFRVENDFEYETVEFPYEQGAVSATLELPVTKKVYINDDLYRICYLDDNNYGEYIKEADTSE